MQQMKDWIKTRLVHAGYRVLRIDREAIRGIELEDDLNQVVGTSSPLCVDVGANEGQTVDLLRKIFDSPVIHAFEPIADTCDHLRSALRPENLTVNCAALGAKTGTATMYRYPYSTFNSTRSMSAAAENPYRNMEAIAEETVQVMTLDSYRQEHAIEAIDLLKIDVQGAELDVLAGAQKCLSEGVIKHILIELNFIQMYDDQSSAKRIDERLLDADFRLVDYYEKVHFNNRLSWCTALYSLTDGSEVSESRL